MRRIARVIYCSYFLLVMISYPALANPLSTNYFRFRTPHEASYRIEVTTPALRGTDNKVEWLKAWPEDGSTNFVQLGNRVVLQLKSGDALKALIAGHSLQLDRTINTNTFILQAPDAYTAVEEAQRLADLPEVIACYPVTQAPADLSGPYAPRPNDQYILVQWYLENRNGDGTMAGLNLNARAAWPYTRGEGITVAVADQGVQLSHPDLAKSVAGAPHFNFTDGTTNGNPFALSSSWAHATEVAGLIAAEANNSIGMAGMAPNAQLASWVIFTPTNQLLATDEQMMDMYQYQSNTVSIQNHSWNSLGVVQHGPGLLEQVGISNAISQGRSGRGVIMVRSAGNGRMDGANADDDGYPSDPRIIAVGAVRQDGRVTSYSEPGACVLVGAPSGDVGLNGLFTTDLTGTDGINQINYAPPNQTLSDYVYDSLGFTGTSASAPQIAGVATLILGANTNLTYRDVQQILILSARHFDFADPDLTTNGAGFRVSHNLGFGIPDAGAAVNLARNWSNRPPQTSVTLTDTNQAAIPDDGLRLVLTGTNIPLNLTSVHTLPSVGVHADVPTLNVPLVDVGTGIIITNNLTNKAALIVRGNVNFSFLITRAAQAGAAFAVIYNNTNGTATCGGGDTLCAMGATDFAPIPAVFIGQTDGKGLSGLSKTNASALAQIQLNSTNYTFNVTNTLSCEQIGVRLKTDHPLRGDVRITLVSPQGTRSVLQTYNNDVSAGPVDWTYYSTHHFFESSAGTWTLYVSDEAAGASGNVLSASLTIYGVPITDSDHDGLDDAWEMAQLGTLAYGPKDDPDKDGYNNAQEQILGTNPLAMNVPFQLDLSRWNANTARLSWSGSPNYTYQIWGGTNTAALNLLTNLPGRFPETEWFAPSSTVSNQFYRVIGVQNP
ncbi:MAG: Peptidase and in kexin sedolisin [Pedosphaera sp.]|nr:Peptidase and in kexin sedolisin [Pedosphaera sp.]